MTALFDVSNSKVRQVITPDGIGSFVFLDADDPNKVYVQIKIGNRKLADFKAYPAEKCEEVEK